MPFTPAHVAAVLPVVGRRGRWVVPAAWVVGSMSPDLVYFTPVGWVRPLSHSLTGLLTLDPALGVLVARRVVDPARSGRPGPAATALAGTDAGAACAVPGTGGCGSSWACSGAR